MKQKIVIKVQMNCEKCRTKAKKIAAEANGVTSVALDGAAKDQIVVIGEEIDSVKLAKCLRRKVGYANIMSVQEEKDKGKKDGGEDEKKGEDKYSWPLTPYHHVPSLYYYPHPHTYEVVHESNPNICTIF